MPRIIVGLLTVAVVRPAAIERVPGNGSPGALLSRENNHCLVALLGAARGESKSYRERLALGGMGRQGLLLMRDQAEVVSDEGHHNSFHGDSSLRLLISLVGLRGRATTLSGSGSGGSPQTRQEPRRCWIEAIG
jgi:hypothetical protein